MSGDNKVAEEKGQGEKAGSRWRELYQAEDYWAIWLGLAIIAIGLLVFLPRPPNGMDETIRQSDDTMKREAEAAPFRTMAWYRASDAKGRLKATSGDLAGTIKKYTGKPHGWTANPLDAFVVTDARLAQKNAKAQARSDAVKHKANNLEAESLAARKAAEADVKNEELGEKAASAEKKWEEAKIEASEKATLQEKHDAAKERADHLEAEAEAAEQAAREAGFKNDALNKKATAAIADTYREESLK